MGRLVTHTEYDTRAATAADDDAILDLVGEVMTFDPARPEADFHRWKHAENPFGRSFGRIAVDADGKVISARLMVRWRFRAADGSRLEAVRAVDTVTHPSAQRKGLFSRLTTETLADLEAAGVAVVFNTPNGQSGPGYLKLGWSEIGTAPLAIRPHTPPTRWRRGTPAPPGANKWGLPSTVGLDAAVVPWDELPVDRVRHHGQLTTEASAEFLRWRYGFAPLGYRVLLDGVGRNASAIVVRLRPRGTRTDLVVCHEIGAARACAHLIGRALHETSADVAVRFQARRASDRFVRLAGRGPMVVWRPVTDDAERTIDDIAFTYGDLEIF